MFTGLTLGDLLPELGPRGAWVIGLVVVLAVLRPVGRLGWAVAGALIAGGVASMTAVASGAGLPVMVTDDAGLWALIPWAVLAGLLFATAAGRPLRWEPRSGPSVATSLLWGALVLHVAAAWHGDAGELARVGDGWPNLSTFVELRAGPLVAPLVWPLSTFTRDAAVAVGVLTLVAAVATALGVAATARAWGYTGTSRAAAAAVAWSPPLLLAHDAAPGALVSIAFLVWSWWALNEVWAGRRVPDRMALLAGVLLGAAVGANPWVLLVAPLWLRRMAGRKLGWFVVGLLTALVASLASLVPGGVSIASLWQVGLVIPSLGLGIAAWWALLPAAISLAVVLRRVPLSPTRLSAVTAALLVLSLPWWPLDWLVTGPVLATPFVLLAAVAPDRPDERWPPDAPVAADEVPVEVTT